MKHFHFKVILFFFVNVTWMYTYSQQVDSLVLKIKDKQDVIYTFQESIWSNPATHLNYRKYNLTSLSIATISNKEAATLAQEGKDKKSMLLQADAFNRLDEKSAVWGGASYRQGRNKEVHWNESADYALIFPYVVADSIGGDIKYEHYAVEGGYVQQIGRYNLGISGFYKARMEYRNIDPRPKNLATQVGGTLGISRDFSPHFTIGIQANIEKYTQKHKMSFYSPTGFPVIYEMNGMGNFNNMLKGKRREAFYDGWAYGTAIQMYESQAKTWFVTGGVTHFRFEKLLPEFYDVQASKAKDLSYVLTAGKLFDLQPMQIGFVIQGTKQIRKGTENLFINATTNNFIKIGQEERYRFEESQLHFRSILNYSTDRNDYSLLPFVAFLQQTERYTQPFSKTTIASMQLGFQGQWMHKFENKGLVTVESLWSLNKNTKEQATFSYGNSQAINQMLLSNYALQIADYWKGDFKVRYDFTVARALDVFVVGEYQYQNIQDHGNNSTTLISLGITF